MATPSEARLPRAVRPVRYDLTIEPDLTASVFTGDVAITLDVHEPTRTVVCNARDLDLATASVVQQGTTIPASIVVEAMEERVTFQFERDLAPGEAVLHCAFTGKLHDDLVGFYRSRYVDAGGVERTIAATQFEATHARRAFPCFDEPDLKAVFASTLVVDADLLVLSNTSEVSRDDVEGGKVRVQFADTMPMSTYLVAFVVGPLELTDAQFVRDVPVRVAHVPGKAHLTQWPLEVATFALAHFEDYYGIPYPGDKLDLVALPDFAFGAMENLGCVTFRESLLLADPEHATQAELTQASLTIVHEIAHMWFGDLVTMKWWNGIWLNEAFATFMEHAGGDAFRREWRTWDDFSVSRTGALEVDALASTRPVEYEVVSPEDADGMFDVLTYQKGGSVVRMLEQYLGEEAFRTGVQQYLERYRFGNTETTDLWDALEAATGRPARRIMDSWIFQPGFPIVSVTTDGRRATFTQRRFSYDDGARAADSPGATSWSVPVLARASIAGNVFEQRVLVEDAEVTVEFDADVDWLFVNAGAHGFYRVSYAPGVAETLLGSGTLSPVERYTLVDDLFAAMLAGHASAAEFLQFCRRFRDERDLIVWRVLLGRLRFLARFVADGDRDRFAALVGELLAPAVAEVGWDTRAGESGRERELRAVLLDAFGTIADDPATIAHAREVRDAAMHGNEVDADVLAASVSIVAHHGTDDDFDEFVTQFRCATTPQEQLRYLYALGQFPSETAIRRALDLAASDEVRTQSAPFLLQRALRNQEHGPYAWAFVRDHWDVFVERFPANLVVRLIEGVQWLLDPAVAADVERFLAAHPFAQGERTIRQHVERLRVHVQAREREASGLAAALRAH
jgi:puromycin-sensitive aminopeptidase